MSLDPAEDIDAIELFLEPKLEGEEGGVRNLVCEELFSLLEAFEDEEAARSVITCSEALEITLKCQIMESFTLRNKLRSYFGSLNGSSVCCLSLLLTSSSC